jgi:hypothetical protein
LSSGSTGFSLPAQLPTALPTAFKGNAQVPPPRLAPLRNDTWPTPPVLHDAHGSGQTSIQSTAGRSPGFFHESPQSRDKTNADHCRLAVLVVHESPQSRDKTNARQDQASTEFVHESPQSRDNYFHFSGLASVGSSSRVPSIQGQPLRSDGGFRVTRRSRVPSIKGQPLPTAINARFHKATNDLPDKNGQLGSPSQLKI